MESAVIFVPLASGRELIKLGLVQVGEIMTTPTRAGERVCFRLTLPEISSSSWRPARDFDNARDMAREAVLHWCRSANVEPIGGEQ